jgi:6-pyruvoyltetrahydropterin/6-carboxytetrahydropterin synthase
MPVARLVRVIEFTARHHYGRSDRSDEWNQARFGDQRRPHEHTYRLEVTVEGEVDPETGFVVDLPRLDALLASVVSPLEGADLNRAVPPVREGAMQPSTEGLALWFRSQLVSQVPGTARLRRIRLWESDTLAGEVDG